MLEANEKCMRLCPCSWLWIFKCERDPQFRLQESLGVLVQAVQVAYFEKTLLSSVCTLKKDRDSHFTLRALALFDAALSRTFYSLQSLLEDRESESLLPSSFMCLIKIAGSGL